VVKYSSPQVSVVIPAYNCAGTIERTISSVLNQTFKDTEIIVVNDGSTDDIETPLKKYASDVILIHQQNGGPSKARNQGISLAKGRYVAFLDADDSWFPEKLERQVDLLERHPEVGFCSTATRVISGDNDRPSPWSCPKEMAGSLLKLLFLNNGAIAGSTSGVLVRRELLEQCGGFDESLKGVEDTDLWMRLAAISGYRCIDTELVTVFKRHGSQSSDLALMLESALRVMKKNRCLLPRRDRGRFWHQAYAGILTDYAKGEYRQGQRIKAIRHLMQAFCHAPIRRGLLAAGLLVAMLSGKPI